MASNVAAATSNSDHREVNSNALLEKLAIDYSNYFKVDIYPSISKLQEFLEESAAKLDELSSLFDMNHTETNDWIDETLPQIIQIAAKTATDIKHRIDTLEELMQEMKITLDKQEVQITQAEQVFGNSGSSFRYVLSYFRKPPETEVTPKISYDPVTFSVDSYFAESGTT